MTTQDEELLAECLLDWEEAREQGRDLPAAVLAGDRGDLAAELERRIRILEETAWLDVPLDEADGGRPGGDEDELCQHPWPGIPRRDTTPGCAAPSPIVGRGSSAGKAALAVAAVVVAGAAVAVLLLRKHAVDGKRPSLAEIRATADADFFHARYADAEAGFTTVLEEHPHDHDALVARGISRLKLGRLDAAVADFTVALERVPDDRDALRQRAQASTYLKRYDDAISDLERLLGAGADAGAIRRQIEALRHARAAAGGQQAAGQPRLP